MFRNKSLSRWGFILASLIVISLILWNTYAFFTQLKANERAKMEIWAAAQGELAQSLAGEGNTVSETALAIIQSNSTTPMILHTLKEDFYDGRNIDPEILKNEVARQKLIDRFTSEYKPLEVKYNDQVLSVIYFGNSPLINKLKYYPAALILIIFLCKGRLLF